MLRTLLYSHMEVLDTKIDNTLKDVERLTKIYKCCNKVGNREARMLGEEIDSKRNYLDTLYIKREALQSLAREYLTYLREECNDD